MGIEKLTEDSTSCEICRELGLRDSKVAQKSDMGNPDTCYGTSYLRYGYNSCLQSDRALIKLMYLNLVKKD